MRGQRQWTAPALVAGLLGFALAAPGAAQQKGDVKPSPAALSDEVRSMQTVATARDLAARGISEESPILLLAAAEMLIANPTQELEGSPDSEVEEGVGGEKEEVEAPLDPAELLDRAQAMAGEGDPLRDVIESMRARLPRGAVGGPRRGTYIVQARSTNTHTISFRGSEFAEIWVEGDGDTDLDCWVYDENGYLIDSDTDFTDTCLLQWMPQWTGPFRLRIDNLGRVWNRYILLTN